MLFCKNCGENVVGLHPCPACGCGEAVTKIRKDPHIIEWELGPTMTQCRTARPWRKGDIGIHVIDYVEYEKAKEQLRMTTLLLEGLIEEVHHISEMDPALPMMQAQIRAWKAWDHAVRERARITS